MLLRPLDQETHDLESDVDGGVSKFRGSFIIHVLTMGDTSAKNSCTFFLIIDLSSL